MAFNISNFRTNMLGDGARPNLFDVQLTLGNLAALAGATSLAEDFRFKCRAAQIPGSTLGVVNVPYFGREVKFAGNRTFADWTVTIINDEDFLIRDFFETWMDRINEHTNNVRTITQYFCQAVVTQFRKDGGPAAQYNFVNIFPTDLSAIDLDWGSNDAIEEFTVNFTYDYWTSRNTNRLSQTFFNRTDVTNEENLRVNNGTSSYTSVAGKPV